MTVAQAGPPVTGQHRWSVLALRTTAVVGLAVDGALHLRLAPVLDQLGAQITMGTLFRVEALAAAGAAAYLCARDSRRAWLVGGLVALGGLVAVLTSRYADLPSFGPLPDATDPTWSRDKGIATAAMAATCIAWAVRELLRGRPAVADAEGAERRL